MTDYVGGISDALIQVINHIKPPIFNCTPPSINEKYTSVIMPRFVLTFSGKKRRKLVYIYFKKKQYIALLDIITFRKITCFFGRRRSMQLSGEYCITYIKYIKKFQRFCPCDFSKPLYQAFLTKRSHNGEVYPADTVVLQQVPRGTRAPSRSPFPLKLETYLRLAQIPYQVGTHLCYIILLL